MIVAIISDTHLPRGQRALPAQCLARLRTADHILHAGDFSTTAVLEELRGIGPPISAVSGNVDEPELRASLPQTLVLQFEGVTLAMVHDSGPDTGRARRLRTQFADADAVVFGHSHIPLLEHHEGLTLFNPGSPTDRRRQPQHSMGIAEIAGGEIAFGHVLLGA